MIRRRRESFERIAFHTALWWLPAGHTPSLPEARERLAQLRAHGPTPFAFSFRARFAADDDAVIVEDALSAGQQHDLPELAPRGEALVGGLDLAQRKRRRDRDRDLAARERREHAALEQPGRERLLLE